MAHLTGQQAALDELPADPTKHASADILLVWPESSTIQVTGSVNGMSHTVGISLQVD